ncbi:phospholipase D/nuclease [Coemansia reversa NRRL 1564]|uniref:Phospholipase D/nuclease n=1 Tax=Coemansia reversa (strain ATCC 12441 / NRRL 1564) TaxID=763665 RepID=A0A2G5B2Z1_COERN|nr:phospholipase D/nuclease [Coemansia reversa NRRL 1564]|eukprot:PIA13366.1 phospholipase D/nuclease [Coemansia reversa NRRL 1564]
MVINRTTNAKLKYPDGAVLITRLKDTSDNHKNSVSFSELLDAAELTEALLTTFTIEMDWLLSHFQPDTKLTLIADQRQLSKKMEDNKQQQLLKQYAVRMVTPEFIIPEVQIMHTKLMLLFYPRNLRLVVSSANLVEDEWTILQNSVFVQDFPLDIHQTFVANKFSKDLAYSLHDLSVPFAIIARLNNVNFAKAKVSIVSSVPTGNKTLRQHMNMDSYGMLRLAKIIDNPKKIDDNNLEFEPCVRLYCVGSSLGNMDIDWLRDFYLCAHGVDPEPFSLDKRREMVSDDLIDIGVGFHTKDQVGQCRYDADRCGQYIFARKDVYEAKNFVHSTLLHIKPQIENTLVHSKAIVARIGTLQKSGWIYIGSHNFTPAAWGKLYRGGKPYFNNYEFGVVLNNVVYQGGPISTPSQAIWNQTPVPLPFELVWIPYARNDIPYINETL